jgi:hypothetical protein
LCSCNFTARRIKIKAIVLASDFLFYNLFQIVPSERRIDGSEEITVRSNPAGRYSRTASQRI